MNSFFLFAGHSFALYFLKSLVLVFFFVSSSGMFANGFNSNTATSIAEYKQWFMGALLTPNAKTVPPEHPGLEVVLVASENYGYYDHDWRVKYTSTMWAIAPYFDFQASFNKIVGVELVGSIITNFKQGKSSTHLQDTIFRLGFQISDDKENSWIPDFRILVQEIFPTGKYQRLNPRKKGIDLTGEGSYQTGVHLVLQKLYNYNNKHPISLRFDVGYFIPAMVNIHGLNYYGGDSFTRGTVYPGNIFKGFLFGQIALTRRCAIALELNYQHGEPGKFSGKQNVKVNVSSFDQLCALPEIQFTLTEKIGLIFGGWMTLAGKNTTAFRGVLGAALFNF